VPSARTPTEALLGEIAELHAILLRIVRRIEDNTPLTATPRLALIEIASVGPLRLRNLASRMDTTPANVSRAVDILEEFGFVARQPDLDDRRATQVVATTRGRRWVERRRGLLLQVLEEISPEIDARRLARGLEQLNTVLRDATGHDEVARGALLAR
jgi:DNA-binding MarR family transcriptional regulator